MPDPEGLPGAWVRMWKSGCGGWGSGFGVWGIGAGGWGVGLRVWFRCWGRGFRDNGLRCRM